MSRNSSISVAGILCLQVLFFSCASPEKKSAGKISADSIPEKPAEELKITTEYRYAITHLKTGRKYDLSLEEYLQSDYIDNPEYGVMEYPVVKK